MGRLPEEYVQMCVNASCPNIHHVHIHTHLQYTQDHISDVYPTGNATWILGVVGDSNGVEELSCAPHP